MNVVHQHTFYMEWGMFLQSTEGFLLKRTFQNNTRQLFDSLSDVMKNICFLNKQSTDFLPDKAYNADQHTEALCYMI